MANLIIEAMERKILPDLIIRFGIRKLCKERLNSLKKGSLEQMQESLTDYIKNLRSSPVALHTDLANKQHYELPHEFFNLVLGKNKKYSSAFWPHGCQSLDEAEQEALNITMARADLQDGFKILELGCGWGSLTLAMAHKFPNSKITAVSNSTTQRLYIENELRKRNLKNVKILTKDVTTIVTLDEAPFNRVVSVEMFEHLRNYEEILRRISTWLLPDGKLFIHIFTHKNSPYFFETKGDDDWMGKYFFTGGQMPSHNLLSHFQMDLRLEEQWVWDGHHYAKTSEAWLKNMDTHEKEILSILRKVYGNNEAKRWFQRWRIFFMSCAELFSYRKGSEWAVSHYLFSNR